MSMQDSNGIRSYFGRGSSCCEKRWVESGSEDPVSAIYFNLSPCQTNSIEEIAKGSQHHPASFN